MRPVNIPGIVVVGKYKGRRGWLIDVQCDKKYYLTVSVETHGGIWRACDSATSEMLAAGRSSRATLKAALLRWRQEIDAEEDDEA